MYFGVTDEALTEELNAEVGNLSHQAEYRAMQRLEEAKIHKIVLKDHFQSQIKLQNRPITVLSARSLKSSAAQISSRPNCSPSHGQLAALPSKLDYDLKADMLMRPKTSRSNYESMRLFSGARFVQPNSFLSKATTEASNGALFGIGKTKASFEANPISKRADIPGLAFRKISLPENTGSRLFSGLHSQKVSDRLAVESTANGNLMASEAAGAQNGGMSEPTFLTGTQSPRSDHQERTTAIPGVSIKIHEYKRSDLSAAQSTAEMNHLGLEENRKTTQNYLLKTPLDPRTFGGLVEQSEKDEWKKRRAKKSKEPKDGVFFNKIRHYSRIFNPKEKSSLIFGKLGRNAKGQLGGAEVLETPHLGRVGNKPAAATLQGGLSHGSRELGPESRGSVETRSQLQKKKREIEQINERIITYSTFSVPNTAWGDYKPYQKEIEKIEHRATGGSGSTKPMSVVELWSRDYHGDVMSKAEHKKFRMRIQRYLHVLHRQGQGNSTISKLILQTGPTAKKDSV